MSFVTKDLDLVLFLSRRNRIRNNCREAVCEYIQRRSALYARRCNQEQETAAHRKLRHLIGVERGRNWCGAFEGPLKLTRDLIKEAPWKLSPNRYDVPLEVNGSRKGSGGAHWQKLHTHKSLQEKKPEKRVRYNVVMKTKNISWKFPGNARERRPTLRCMVTSPNGCFRDPNEPGPMHYTPKHHMIEYLASPPIVSKPPNPHKFLRYSSVPEKASSLVPRHISMDPAPGRYETRYPFVCACNPKLIYMPGLRILIDRQKRNRFRQLPYERIKARLFCDPEWRHVKGHGFRFLFKTSSRGAHLRLKTPIKASDNLRLKLFHDQRYMDLITEPERLPISNPSGFVPELPTRIKYNSLSKRVIRKQLRSNKKIAFNSGQERWKDGYRLPPITFAQQQKNKESLPLERQLRDYPVMRVSKGLIPSKLMETPKHMLPAYFPELRKRLFKFLPLPVAKVLVTEQDTRPPMVDGKYQCESFYAKEIVPEDFFIDAVEHEKAEEGWVRPQAQGTESNKSKEGELTDEEERPIRDVQKVRLST